MTALATAPLTRFAPVLQLNIHHLIIPIKVQSTLILAQSSTCVVVVIRWQAFPCLNVHYCRYYPVKCTYSLPCDWLVNLHPKKCTVFLPVPHVIKPAVSMRCCELTYCHYEIVLELYWYLLCTSHIIHFPWLKDQFVLVWWYNISRIKDDLTEPQSGYNYVDFQSNFQLIKWLIHYRVRHPQIHWVILTRWGLFNCGDK